MQERERLFAQHDKGRVAQLGDFGVSKDAAPQDDVGHIHIPAGVAEEVYQAIVVVSLYEDHAQLTKTHKAERGQTKVPHDQRTPKLIGGTVPHQSTAEVKDGQIRRGDVDRDVPVFSHPHDTVVNVEASLEPIHCS